LKGERKAPGNGATDERKPVINPVDEAETGNIHHHLKHDEFTPPFQL
jgi:hypothetical protein